MKENNNIYNLNYYEKNCTLRPAVTSKCEE